MGILHKIGAWFLWKMTGIPFPQYLSGKFCKTLAIP